MALAEAAGSPRWWPTPCRRVPVELLRGGPHRFDRVEARRHPGLPRSGCETGAAVGARPCRTRPPKVLSGLTRIPVAVTTVQLRPRQAHADPGGRNALQGLDPGRGRPVLSATASCRGRPTCPRPSIRPSRANAAPRTDPGAFGMVDFTLSHWGVNAVTSRRRRTRPPSSTLGPRTPIPRPSARYALRRTSIAVRVRRPAVRRELSRTGPSRPAAKGRGREAFRRGALGRGARPRGGRDRPREAAGTAMPRSSAAPTAGPAPGGSTMRRRPVAPLPQHGRRLRPPHRQLQPRRRPGVDALHPRLHGRDRAGDDVLGRDGGAHAPLRHLRRCAAQERADLVGRRRASTGSAMPACERMRDAGTRFVDISPVRDDLATSAASVRMDPDPPGHRHRADAGRSVSCCSDDGLRGPRRRSTG